MGIAILDNLTKDEITVGLKFAGEDKETFNIDAGDEITAASPGCTLASCGGSVEIISRTPLIVPTLRYTDTTGQLQENLGGSLTVTRDGGRVP